MSLNSLENEIVRELKIKTGNKKLTKKSIMEWQTGKDLKPHNGEKLEYIEFLGISVCYKE